MRLPCLIYLSTSNTGSPILHHRGPWARLFANHEANSYAGGGFAVRRKSSSSPYVRRSVCPENVGLWSCSPQNDFGVFSKIYPELFPASPGAQLQEITVSTFSIQLGQIRLQSPIGSKKNIFFVPIGDGNPVGSKKC